MPSFKVPSASPSRETSSLPGPTSGRKTKVSFRVPTASPVSSSDSEESISSDPPVTKPKFNTPKPYTKQFPGPSKKPIRFSVPSPSTSSSDDSGSSSDSSFRTARTRPSPTRQTPPRLTKTTRRKRPAPPRGAFGKPEGRPRKRMRISSLSPIPESEHHQIPASEAIENVLAHNNITDATAAITGETRSLSDWISGTGRPLTRKTKGGGGAPEFTIWHVMISLLNAVTFLQTGERDDEDENEHAGWMPIVHNFIHPANIFLSERDVHGPCKLGNYTRCVVLQSALEPEGEKEVEERSAAFEHMRDEVETGYEAPELLLDSDDSHPGLASDLWSIGAVVVAMMTNGRSIWDIVREIKFLEHARSGAATGTLLEDWRQVPLKQRVKYLRDLDARVAIQLALPGWYSTDLRAFVEALVSSDPLGRGKARELLDEAIGRFERMSF